VGSKDQDSESRIANSPLLRESTVLLPTAIKRLMVMIVNRDQTMQLGIAP